MQWKLLNKYEPNVVPITNYFLLTSDYIYVLTVQNNIDFCIHWKPIHDFLLVINCNLSFILPRFRPSRSFNVIDFCSNRKPIYNFLLMITQTVTKLYVAPLPKYSATKEVRNHPTLVWGSQSREPSSTFVVKLIKPKVEIFRYIWVKTA